MKKHLKAILAAILLLVLCAAMTGCGDNKAKNPENITEKDANQALSSYNKDNAKNGSTSASIEKLDPFEKLEVTFDKMPPGCEIHMTGNSSFVIYTGHIKGSDGSSTTIPFFSDGCSLFTNVINGIKNGDTVTITAEIHDGYHENKYTLTQTEKNYTVEGLN